MIKQIDNFILKDNFDENEFGICYKANDNNNLYAIKKINIQNKEFVNNEIKILKTMKSKYSIEFIELIEKNDYLYLILELCDGNLNDLLKKKNGNLDITTIFDIIFQLNEVLQLMHSKELEHINLKPENILIKNKNYFYIKLSDYILTKNFPNNNNSKFINNRSIYYQAPEVYQNKRNRKSNLWSIGLILYYLYFNQLPFIEDEDYFNPNKNVILKKTHFKILDDLISKLLIKNPNERINWDEYFNHPFNKQQIIEIHINKEKDEPNSNIINKDFQEQLKDSKILKIFLDGKIKLDFNFVYNKGKHKIIIIFNKNIKSCKLFSFCSDIFIHL